MQFVGTFWALVPPIIAITLALITKEAYSSLFIGVVIGALFACDFAIYSPCMKTARNGAAFGGMGVRIHPE